MNSLIPTDRSSTSYSLATNSQIKIARFFRDNKSQRTSEIAKKYLHHSMKLEDTVDAPFATVLSCTRDPQIVRVTYEMLLRVTKLANWNKRERITPPFSVSMFLSAYIINGAHTELFGPASTTQRRLERQLQFTTNHIELFSETGTRGRGIERQLLYTTKRMLIEFHASIYHLAKGTSWKEAIDRSFLINLIKTYTRIYVVPQTLPISDGCDARPNLVYK
jgi:hypothetical protein